MMITIWAVVKDGKIVPDEPYELRDGQRVLVTLPNGDENGFWEKASAGSQDVIWGNQEDDVYAELLEA